MPRAVISSNCVNAPGSLCVPLLSHCAPDGTRERDHPSVEFRAFVRPFAMFKIIIIVRVSRLSHFFFIFFFFFFFFALRFPFLSLLQLESAADRCSPLLLLIDFGNANATSATFAQKNANCLPKSNVNVVGIVDVHARTRESRTVLIAGAARCCSRVRERPFSNA